jgi:hypothetical protein
MQGCHAVVLPLGTYSLSLWCQHSSIPLRNFFHPLEMIWQDFLPFPNQEMSSQLCPLSQKLHFWDRVLDMIGGCNPGPTPAPAAGCPGLPGVLFSKLASVIVPSVSEPPWPPHRVFLLKRTQVGHYSLQSKTDWKRPCPLENNLLNVQPITPMFIMALFTIAELSAHQQMNG